MKFSALALDYDGTIAVNGVLDPAVRKAIAEARERGIVVVLVTGRQLADLRRVAGDLRCFDVAVCENGAVLDFPASGRHVVIGHPPNAAVIEELTRRGVSFTVGETVVETDADSAAAVLDVVRRLEQPLSLAFNRGRLMGCRRRWPSQPGSAGAARPAGIHSQHVGIGDAENDHDLLDSAQSLDCGRSIGHEAVNVRSLARR